MYNMSGIKMSNYIAKELDIANRKFFWTNNLNYAQNISGTSSVAWNKICRPKCEGGLDIRKTQDFNAAM